MLLSSCRVVLDRSLHEKFLLTGLGPLPSGYVGLDASMPWICYWLSQSLDALGCPIPPAVADRLINTFKACQHPDGGFGGGPNQIAHLATTYSAVAALAVVGTEEAYNVIDVEGLKRFLLRMKQPDGSFTVHPGGEADCRGTYCALACAALTGLLDVEGMRDKAGDFVSSCQTYEGGLGAVPYAEAHAGYTYCGFAALAILGEESKVDLKALEAFARSSQCPQTGGFRGRANKLVDGCYSFWTGSLFPLLRRVLPDLPSLDWEGLQRYILIACQDLKRGGLKDKPEKSVDYYHTCYCLAGLNVAQNEPGAQILGGPANRLEPIDSVYNLRPTKVTQMKRHFQKGQAA